MPKAPTSAPPAVTELVEHFQRNLDQYRSPQYKEAEVRREFIDPFFEALGWDVQNKRKYAEAYKDVVHEPSLDEEGAFSRAPDYSFQPAGHIKFFVEAKKPSVNLDETHPPALQLRRYGWTQQLPISILTNFAQFAVYDCRMEPGPADGASTARVLYYTFDEYAAHWDELVGLFSPDAVFKGSFDRFAETRKRKGVAPFDQRFLDDMEAWRKRLAENLALRNHGLSQPELNYAVQQTIDRILFLRICEARAIEPPERLLGVAKLPDVYANLVQHFRRADDEYNSGLFHFHQERGRLQPDELTPSLKLDDEVLRVVIGQLYWPARPYAFEVVPADILGQVYERFLGKVIRLTAGHHARVEERPEVKKAGGVYYTPTYIVDYIVESTVGKLLEGKTPKQASKLRILDPACGSGSFLLGAYDYLLKWYLHAYIAEGSEKHKDRLYPAGGSWKLTIREKKQILLDNIYGVDIDSQAVEVTKLSLLLKVLEGESEQTAKPRLIKEPALPDLDKNIKCGNSLIGPDFFDKGAKEPVAEEERRQVNAFDWATEFAETAKRGGFDAVIGNPPYIGFHGFSESKAYLKKRFRSARGKFDYYLPFIEAGLSLLLKGGRLGFICPTNFMKREHGLGLRKLLRTDTSIQQIVDFEDVQVFEGALNYTGVFILSRQEPSQDHIFPYRRRALEATPLNVSQKVLTDDVWVFRDDSRELVVTKMRAQTVTSLGDLVQGISEGIVTGHNDVFFVDAAQAKKGRFESDVLKPCLRGSEIRRYFAEEPHHKVVYPYKLVDGVTTVITEADLRKYPRLLSYLSECRRKLSGRSYFEESSKHWYELWCQRDLNLLATEKIVVPELAESSRFALADNSVFYGDTVCGIVPLPSIPERVEYLLALLNSKLMDFYYKATTVPKANRFYIYKTMFLRKVPIRRIDFKNDEESRCHERLVGFAKEMLASSSRLAKALTGHESTSIQRQIEATDRHIDQLVYKLYKLTPEEIALVEGYPAEPLKVQ